VTARLTDSSTRGRPGAGGTNESKESPTLSKTCNFKRTQRRKCFSDSRHAERYAPLAWASLFGAPSHHHTLRPALRQLRGCARLALLYPRAASVPASRESLKVHESRDSVSLESARAAAGTAAPRTHHRAPGDERSRSGSGAAALRLVPSSTHLRLAWHSAAVHHNPCLLRRRVPCRRAMRARHIPPHHTPNIQT
jgi:hypothetical protein